MVVVCPLTLICTCMTVHLFSGSSHLCLKVAPLASMLQTNHLLSLTATYTVQYLAATTTASLDCMVLASFLNLHVCEINLGGDLGMRPIRCLKASLVLSVTYRHGSGNSGGWCSC